MTTQTKNKAQDKAPAAGEAKPEKPAPRPARKIDQVITLLERKQGATLTEMTDATGWQPHSARAVLTGLRKKGHTIVKSKRDEVTCYRVTEAN